MKILVTGSEGNIGRQLVPYLRRQGHKVFGVDIVQAYKDDFKTTDINNGADLAAVFLLTGPEVVIHLAAMVSRVTCEYSPVTAVHTNVAGTMNIISLCRQFNARLLYFSTSEVYGNVGGDLHEGRACQPNNLYGLTKLLGEMLVQYERRNGLQALIVRPFMFYHEDETTGDHRSAFIRFAATLAAGGKVTVHKYSARCWMHLDDAVRVIERLCFVEEYAIVNVGNPVPIATERLAELFCAHLGLDPLEHITLTDLPAKMTLTKFADFALQQQLTGVACSVTIEAGIERVIQRFRQ